MCAGRRRGSAVRWRRRVQVICSVTARSDLKGDLRRVEELGITNLTKAYMVPLPAPPDHSPLFCSHHTVVLTWPHTGAGTVVHDHKCHTHPVPTPMPMRVTSKGCILICMVFGYQIEHLCRIHVSLPRQITWGHWMCHVSVTGSAESEGPEG